MTGKTPPYASPLRALLSQGLRPVDDIFLFIGTKAWQKCEGLSITFPDRLMMIPAWSDPSIYSYPVTDCSILLFDTGWAKDDYVEDTVSCLFEDGAKKVYFFSTDFKTQLTYHKDVSHV